MIKLFTKNLDTMGKTTKKNLDALNDLNLVSKADMSKLLGGNEKDDDKKNKGGGSGFFGLFSPNPCRGDLPQ